MRKGLFLILALVMCLSLCACGGSTKTGKCTICGKSATHTFQGYGYCDKHYSNAVRWAIDNVSGK